jgi:DNA (cytosine-5)-methyltransferase 1
VLVLDLFSGIGGFSLGLERAGMRTVAFCEIDPYCRAVLRKHWPGVPIHEDVRDLHAWDTGPVDLICGGYPCQPFSSAGKRRGTQDDRHLWPEYRRLVEELRPAWVLGENVVGHVTLGLDTVLSDLEALGYETRSFVVPACAVSAPHKRERVWILANSDSGRWDAQPLRCASAQEGHGAIDADGASTALGGGKEWAPEPRVGRVAHGVYGRVDRLTALGNAVVPQITEILGLAIMNSIGGRD